MKNFRKIFWVYIIFCVGCSVSLAQTQTVNTFCEDGGFETGVINMNDFRYGFGNFFSPNNSSAFSATKLILNPIPSGGFPSAWVGNSNWGPFYGKFYEGITTPSAANAGIEYPIYNLGCCGQSPVPQNQVHHQIQTVGSDLLLDTLLPRVHSGNHSMRLGNAAIDKGAEMMQKTFDVTPSTAQMSFWYAAVMGDPCEAGEMVQQYDTNTGQFSQVSCPSTHVVGGKTNFIIKIYNHTDGTFHDNLVNLGAGQNFIDNTSPLLTSAWNYRKNNVLQMQRDNVKYTPWSFVSIPLHTLMGKRISIYFITTDCNAAGHFSYAYLDDFCTQPSTDNPSGSIKLQNDLPDCGEGEICVDYSLPVLSDGTTGQVNLNLDIYQNGNLVNTLSSGTLNSGSNYCFAIDNTLLNSLGGTHFDYVVKGDFSINSVSLPSQTLGVPGYGQNANQNDDYAIECNQPPQLCCEIPDLQVSIRKPRFGSDQLSLVLGGITTPIQEIEVSVVDYQYTYGDEACKPANLGIFGNLSSSQNILNGLNLSGNGDQVIRWTAGSPAVFNGQIPIKISKPNILKLSCCKGTFNVCLKVKVVDVNCNVCEKLVCIELPLEEQKIISNDLPADQIKQ